ncbi:DUF4112 domain-containing protein [Marivivens marinus]|uniref:DUF4112 domain-containing protein n=1 Tax=Marivivens marinus TaxID=3110173 RepID=UPI003B84A84F
MNIEPQTIDSELARLRRVAWRMDALFYIPGTNWSVGLDNILGLVPVVGDVATLAPSVWMIWKARQLGATPGALAYMSCNLLADLLIGSIPLVGDIFDVVYNANIRNYRLLEKNLAKVAARAEQVTPPPTRRIMPA